MSTIRALIGSLIGLVALAILFLLTLLGQVPAEFIWPLLCPAALALGLLLPLGPMVDHDIWQEHNRNWR